MYKFILLVVSLLLFSCEKVQIEDIPTFDKTYILSVNAYNEKTNIIVGTPLINTETGSISVVVKKDADLSKVFFVCSISIGATITPALTGYSDWTSKGREFTVTSASGTRSQKWNVTLEFE